MTHSKCSTPGVFCRCAEMDRSRRLGFTGTQSQYNDLCRELPQETRVLVCYLVDAPQGYDPDVYGPWPEGGAIVTKTRHAPTHKSFRNPANWLTGNLAHTTLLCALPEALHHVLPGLTEH